MKFCPKQHISMDNTLDRFKIKDAYEVSLFIIAASQANRLLFGTQDGQLL